MNARRFAFVGLLAAMALAVVAVTGCSKKTRDALVPNIAPSVRMTAAPFDTTRATPYFYAYRMNWIGNDPDGRVDYFLYAIDPPEDPYTPVQWVRTTKNEQIVFFSADSSDVRNNRATQPHVFALCCVDNQGDTSAVVKRAFFSYTQCPTVTITNPTPNGFFALTVTPSVRIAWTGTDPDGQLTSKPVKYKYILLGPGSRFSVDRALTDPGSLREYYAYKWAENGLPGPWAGWDSTSSDTTNVQFTNLTPNQQYLFVVVSFDEAGAFSPVFDRTQNMLLFRPGFAGTLGPKITVFNEFFVFQYKGGYTVAPAAEAKLEVPANQKITFTWFADPPSGALIQSYRWMLNGDPFDPTPRANQTDYVHWSDPSLNTTSITVGPFPGGTEQLFYMEATDNNDLASLGVVRMTVVQSSLEKPLLVVNDTRYQQEVVSSTGCLNPPVGDWPNAAELDSFFFARPNVPWTSCAGTIGTTDPNGGLFNGYTYDVLRTKGLPALDKSVRLATLGQYKNLVWIVDGGAGTPINSNLYSLRFMSAVGRVNTVGAYVRQGGHVWITGGGGAGALCRDLFNSSSNDQPTWTYSNRVATELQPGRFMYDIAHWRSELQNFAPANAAIKRSSRAVQTNGQPWSWNMTAWEGQLSSPDYTKLPASLDAKTQGTDVLPATRLTRPTSFYRSRVAYNMEYLTQGNSIIEDVDPDLGNVLERSTLDTLYRSEAVLLGGLEIWEQGGRNADGTVKPNSIPGTPVMTYYHGTEFPRFVFTGFDIWNYQRPQLAQLVDFVLQDIFGLPPRSTAAFSTRVVRGAPPAWSPPVTQPQTVLKAGRAVSAGVQSVSTRRGSSD